MPDRNPARAATLLAVVVAAAVGTSPSLAGQPHTTQRACLTDLARGTSREIACEYPLFLTEEERAELRRVSRDYVQDLTCTASVRITRALVTAALAEPDTTFAAPPQPVTCTIATTGEAVTITGTFAPRVVFKGGRAVQANPGLADVKGVHAAIAWPLVAWVNASTLIGTGMVDAINAYKDALGRRAAAGPGRSVN